MARPDLSRIPEFYHNYIRQVKGDDLMEVFRIQLPEISAFLESIPASKQEYRYADGKWSVKEVLQHIIDAERVFAYRAVCIARKDQTPLPGFDENAYALYSKANTRDWDDLIGEFRSLKMATEYLFGSFDEEQLDTTGTASGKSIYVLGIGFIIAGHVTHHFNILKERYL